MLATRASDNAVLTLYCNLVGGQDHLIFDGGSTIFGPGGDLIARAPMFREHLLTVDLDVEEVRQTRLHDPRLRRLPQTQADLCQVSSDRLAERGQALDAELIDALTDDEQVYEALVLGTRDYVHKTGFSDVVIALSGRDRLDPDGCGRG